MMVDGHLIEVIPTGVTVFFFNDTATTEIYTLSLHDALPICHRGRARRRSGAHHRGPLVRRAAVADLLEGDPAGQRSEEHTSELQSRPHLVCRLLLEKKKYFVLRSASLNSLGVVDVVLPHRRA